MGGQKDKVCNHCQGQLGRCFWEHKHIAGEILLAGLAYNQKEKKKKNITRDISERALLFYSFFNYIFFFLSILSSFFCFFFFFFFFSFFFILFFVIFFKI